VIVLQFSSTLLYIYCYNASLDAAYTRSVQGKVIGECESYNERSEFIGERDVMS